MQGINIPFYNAGMICSVSRTHAQYSIGPERLHVRHKENATKELSFIYIPKNSTERCAVTRNNCREIHTLAYRIADRGPPVCKGRAETGVGVALVHAREKPWHSKGPNVTLLCGDVFENSTRGGEKIGR